MPSRRQNIFHVASTVKTTCVSFNLSENELGSAVGIGRFSDTGNVKFLVELLSVPFLFGSHLTVSLQCC
jgi:hypothetical protein